MNQSLNTVPSIREYTNLVYRFKRWYNWYNRMKGYKRRLFLFNPNLYGLDKIFDLWLSFECDILNLDKHMQELEKNYTPKELYLKRATGYYKIVNR